METTILGLGFRQQLFIGIIGYSILGLYWDNRKENGNYYFGFRV